MEFKDLGNQKTEKKCFQDLHFEFSCMNLLLDLALIPVTVSLQVQVHVVRFRKLKFKVKHPKFQAVWVWALNLISCFTM